jgi:Spy/CpxP family protein refolding chaperone
MKTVIAVALAGVVFVGAASVYAGGNGCCMAGKSKSSANAGASCQDMMSKLNLTDEQKAKVAALKDQTSRAVSTSERMQQFSDGLKQILTAEQLTQWNDICTKAKASGQCPFTGEKLTKKS